MGMRGSGRCRCRIFCDTERLTKKKAVACSCASAILSRSPVCALGDVDETHDAATKKLEAAAKS